MKDNFYRMMTKDGSVRMFALDATDMVAKAAEIHRTSPVCTAALGRALGAVSLMGAMLKGEGSSVTLQIRGNGPAGAVLAVGDCEGNTKGYVVNPQVELPLNAAGKLDVAGAVGREGSLCVIKDLNMKEPYVGQVPIVSGEIAEDLTEYFTASEQIPTACILGVLVDRDYSVAGAGALLIQALPYADEEVLAQVEKNLSEIGSLSSLIAKGMSLPKIADKILGEGQYDILEQSCADYVCDCSRERVVRAVSSLGKDELKNAFEQEETLEVNCQFCDKTYRVSRQDVMDYLAGGKEKKKKE